MRELLLDTIVFDFLLRDPAKIPIKSRLAIEQADTVFVSAVSLWELSNHVRDGKFTVSISYESYFRRALRTHSLTLLLLQWKALEYMSSFPYQIATQSYEKTVDGKAMAGVKTVEHRDTFDRMLIAHALTGKHSVISPDTLFPMYEPLGLTVIWK